MIVKVDPEIGPYRGTMVMALNSWSFTPTHYFLDLLGLSEPNNSSYNYDTTYN